MLEKEVSKQNNFKVTNYYLYVHWGRIFDHEHEEKAVQLLLTRYHDQSIPLLQKHGNRSCYSMNYPVIDDPE